MNAQHILVVGSANIDLVVTTDRRPAAGETVLAGDTVANPGGKGANTAVAAAHLGADVTLLAAIGTDSYGDQLLTSLQSAGVRTTQVHRKQAPTGSAYVMLTPDGDNAILVSPGANQNLQPADVDHALTGTDILTASMEIPLATVEYALQTAAAAGVRTVLNMSPVSALSPAALAAVDVLLMNQHEAAQVLGATTPEAPQRLLELGPTAAVVTLGAQGALVATGQGTHHVTAPQVRAVDTTGAGDAFAGALTSALAADATLSDATHTATRVAAACVTQPGAQLKQHTLTDSRIPSSLTPPI